MKLVNGLKSTSYFGLIPILFLCSSCNVARPEATTRPISSKRSTEVLVRDDGEVPQWKSTGSLSVKPSDALFPTDKETAVVMVRDNKSTQTISARGRDVTIACSDSKLTIFGGCNQLRVTGSGNEITCDVVTEISIEGNTNRVACDSLIGGEVSGSNNTISWKNPIDETRPNIDYQGVNNSLERIEPKPPRYSRSTRG